MTRAGFSILGGFGAAFKFLMLGLSSTIVTDRVNSFRPFRTEQMLSVEQAQEQVLREIEVLGAERVVLTEASGRILRENVLAPLDIPMSDNTAMDGYAVLASDVAGASRENPVSLRVIEDLPAGSVSSQRVTAGTAVRIMTGALMPDGADTVVHVELTDGGSDAVRVFQSLSAGANIRRRGEDMKKGTIVLPSGATLRAGEIGVLASVQKAVLSVGRRPTLAILSTGDEIVDIDQPVLPGKVVNSNSYSLAALVREAGAIPRMVGIVPDTKDATVAAIESALESDLVMSSGGVSVGAYDFVKEALETLGASFKFWQVSMKPGKPLVVARVRERLFFGLPGNPVSCMVSFHLFIAPAIRKAMGASLGDLLPPVVEMKLGAPLRSRGDRRAYQRVRVVARSRELVAIPMQAQGSGVSTSMIGANGLAVLEEGVRSVDAGQIVQVVLLGPVQGE